MKKTTRSPFYLAICAATVAALGACSTGDKSGQTTPTSTAASATPTTTTTVPTTPTPTTSTPAAPRVVPTGETVIGEAHGETDAVIESVDSNTREVTLRGSNGKGYIVKVPPDVDLAKLKMGDGVILGAFQRLTMTVLAPDSAPLGITHNVAMAKPGTGEAPDHPVGEVTRVVAKVVAIDLDNNAITLAGADGSTRALKLNKPESQDLLKSLKVDDLVQIDVFERIEVKLKPKS